MCFSWSRMTVTHLAAYIVILLTCVSEWDLFHQNEWSPVCMCSFVCVYVCSCSEIKYWCMCTLGICNTRKSIVAQGGKAAVMTIEKEGRVCLIVFSAFKIKWKEGWKKKWNEIHVARSRLSTPPNCLLPSQRKQKLPEICHHY